MGTFFTRPAKVKQFDYKPLYYDKEGEEKERRKKIVLANYSHKKKGQRFDREQDTKMNHQQIRLEKARKFIIIIAVLLLVLVFVYVFRMTNLLTLISN